ncbi:MAG TPA: efflux RND transporter permease subunit, partial [Candidatus Binataceae bacterium]|nr:efflux RND transporter permease subunit [Candidatus Binataceae bacterium]
MWIVLLALRRPLSIAVMALLMLVLGVLAFTRMNADIFPAIDLPVVEVVWNYPGLSAVGMERRVVIISERSYSSEVNAIEHIESESLNGIGLIKVYFHEGVSPASGIAEINNTNESELKIFPPGISTADVIEYNAANVPVAQLNLFSDTLSVQQLYDYGLNFARVRLFTIPGLWTPAPFGGMQRAVMVNLNPQQLYAHGLSATDIMQALGAVNTITPAGTVKIGNREYQVELNGSPVNVAEFDHLPVKEVNGAPVHLGDVAPVTYTHSVQTNVVRVNGKPASYLMILKAASASTVGVIDQVKQKLPEMMATAPPGLRMALTFDQSKFVRGALWDVVQEAAVAALLVALMVLVFLGSVRSMLIVVISIPLAALTAIIGLKLSGQTINTMTLGGLALAVGMLVDDATVEIENIHRNHAMGKPLLRAIVDGAAQIAAPAFVGTLAICIVFFPVVLLTGVARFLFTPLAMAVVYAMLTSYLLSRTLVPMMARYLLPERHVEPVQGGWQDKFARRFERLNASYARALESFMAQRGFGMACVGLIVLMSLGLIRVVGEDFFPSVDAGMMRLHVRAPLGTRIETTEQIVQRIETAIRGVIPPSELEAISDNLGMPVSWNLTMYQTDSIGPQDGDIAIELQPRHRSTAYYQGRIRALMARQFPEVTAYFQAADIVAQVLNFGLPAAIDAQVAGNDLNEDYALAVRLKNAMEKIPGLADIRIAQPLNYPTLDVKVDRDKAQQLGLTENDVASSLATSLSASFELQPNSWLNVANGVNYSVLAQVPQHALNSVNALLTTPLTGAAPGQTSTAQFLGNVATVHQDVEPAVVSHYN